MRYLSLTFMVLMAHISMAIFNATGLFAYSLNPDDDAINQFKTFTESDQYVYNEVQENNDPNFTDYVKALSKFVLNFFIGVLLLPKTLQQIGIAFPYSAYISAPVYILYIIALLQIMSKDSYEVKK